MEVDMLAFVVISIWAVLMFRSGFAEYKYYQSVKTLEPEVWQQLGSPKYLKIPMVFVSSTGLKRLKIITNKTVCENAKNHRKAGFHFLIYVMLVLVGSIVYFKVA